MFENLMTQIGNFFMAHKGFAMIVNFLIKHADFILGIIINLILISFFCKLADAFNRKLEKNLLEKHPDSPLVNLMPILTRVAKVVVIFLLLAGFLQSRKAEGKTWAKVFVRLGIVCILLL